MYLRMMSSCVARAAVLTLAASAIGCGGTPTAPANPQPRHTVAGTVTEVAGGARIPVEGVIVTAVATGRSATTDSSGGFVIHEVPAAHATLTAMKTGYDVATISIDVSGDTRVDLLLVRRQEPVLPTVSGIVYEKSAAGPRPVVGAVVESVYTHVAAVTDENGHYRLTYMTGGLGTPDGFDTIRVSKEGFETAVRSLVSNGDLRLDVELLRR